VPLLFEHDLIGTRCIRFRIMPQADVV